jgi:uridylate kinase
MAEVAYQRVLLKLSGEALMGDQSFGIDPSLLKQTAQSIADVHRRGVEVALVVGGGNIYRGASLTQVGINRVTGDHMGMLATVMNGLALRDALRALDLKVSVMSGFEVALCESFDFRKAQDALKAKEIVIFVAGTGNPFFTTDTAATLRGIEIEADVVLKATKVDGIYTADPKKDPRATRYKQVSFSEVLDKNLQVMDTTAFVMCQAHGMPIRVFDMFKEGALQRVIQGEDEGTLVCEKGVNDDQ